MRGVIAASTAAGSRFSVRGVDVGEDGRSAFVEDAVRGRDEGERRRDDLVPLPQSGQAHGEMEPRRAARDRGDVRCADPFGQRLLEAVDHRPERKLPGAKRLQDELLLPLLEPGSGEPDLGGQEPAGALAAYSSQRVQRSSRPRTTSKKVDWIAFVTGPGGPISWSSIARTGVTSAAVPVMKTSSAR